MNIHLSKSWIKKLWWYNFISAGLEQQRILIAQQNCNHDHWDCDTQIKMIVCKKCGKTAWIDDYVDIFTKFKIRK